MAALSSAGVSCDRPAAGSTAAASVAEISYRRMRFFLLGFPVVWSRSDRLALMQINCALRAQGGEQGIRVDEWRRHCGFNQ
jgi:hypothetical protein